MVTVTIRYHRVSERTTGAQWTEPATINAPKIARRPTPNRSRVLTGYVP
jgi:hypothetical protein